MKSNFVGKSVAMCFALLVYAGIATLSAQSYVGSETCLLCHQGVIAPDKTGWRSSMHANGFTVPKGAHSMENLYGVIADADQSSVDDFKEGLDLSTTDAFSAYGSNAPVLGYDSGTDVYTITIGGLTMPVKLTYGGSGLYKQRYVLKVPVAGGGYTAGHYVSPVQYDEKTHEYVAYHPEKWYVDPANGDYTPLYSSNTTAAEVASSGKSFEKGCVGCHFTYIDTLYQNSDNEWIADAPDAGSADISNSPNSVYDIDGDSAPDLVNTGCERCHGPGSAHASSMNAADIINPEDLTTQQANDLCGFCHSRGSSVPSGTFSYAYDDANMHDWDTGDAWSDYYTDGGGYWPDDKTSKKHHQQYFDFYKSSKPTFQWHQVRCYECHDVHNEIKHHIRTEIVEEDAGGNEIAIATDNDNNTLCLACHATHGDFEDITKEMVDAYDDSLEAIAAVVTKHTNHFYDPTGSGASRCSKCHNPKVAKSAVHYDIHSHTFEALSPEKTLDLAMPNSCAVSCHIKTNYPNFGVDVASDNLTAWDEQTDIDLANKLLYWYDNMWFEHLGGEGKTVDALEMATAPTVDGDTTDWAGVEWVDSPLAHDNVVSMKAAYSGSDIYFLVKWADSTLSMTRGGSWSYDGTGWVKSSGQSEDRIAILWNISIPQADWEARGCMNKCHRDADNTNAGNDTTGTEDDAYLPAGQKADMWHMKAARSLGAISASQVGPLTIDPVTHEVTAGTVTLNGYIDDKYMGEFSADNSPDGGRYGDSGTSTYSHNRNTDKTAPKYIETDPADYIDAMILTQTEIDNGEAVEVANLSASDLATYWGKYAGFDAVVPERILTTPSGSRADVLESAMWKDGVWYAEIKRPLNTGNDDDAQFSVAASYKFAMAVMDNGGGEDHWTQGSVLNTLNIGTVSVEPGDVAGIPENYSLEQNYPNPFNPTTTILLKVRAEGRVEVALFNVLGQEIATLMDRYLSPGEYQIVVNSESLSSGIYFYRMTAKTPGGETTFTTERKMVVLK